MSKLIECLLKNTAHAESAYEHFSVLSEDRELATIFQQDGAVHTCSNQIAVNIIIVSFHCSIPMSSICFDDFFAKSS